MDRVSLQVPLLIELTRELFKTKDLRILFGFLDEAARSKLRDAESLPNNPLSAERGNLSASFLDFRVRLVAVEGGCGIPRAQMQQRPGDRLSRPLPVICWDWTKAIALTREPESTGTDPAV
jgi:hypothetical protein